MPFSYRKYNCGHTCVNRHSPKAAGAVPLCPQRACPAGARDSDVAGRKVRKTAGASPAFPLLSLLSLKRDSKGRRKSRLPLQRGKLAGGVPGAHFIATLNRIPLLDPLSAIRFPLQRLALPGLPDGRVARRKRRPYTTQRELRGQLLLITRPRARHASLYPARTGWAQSRPNPSYIPSRQPSSPATRNPDPLGYCRRVHRPHCRWRS